MKRVLITGANSYVGTHVEAWLMKEPDKYYVETLDMKDPNWKSFDFSSFDVVFHVAGIAHVSAKKSMKDLYFKVNRDLAIETAKKAKESGVKQFIFMSSMIVYSSKETRITKETKPNPDNFYGESKLQAEKGIQNLESDNFKVCILRPPMIYGPNSKGNFSKLIKVSRKVYIFPKYINNRSLLYIDNLSEFINLLIYNNKQGVLFPQNRERVSTYNLFIYIRKAINKKFHGIELFNPFITIFINKINIINKLFSDYYYESNLNDYELDYQLIDTQESVVKLMNMENR